MFAHHWLIQSCQIGVEGYLYEIGLSLFYCSTPPDDLTAYVVFKETVDYVVSAHVPVASIPSGCIDSATMVRVDFGSAAPGLPRTCRIHVPNIVAPHVARPIRYCKGSRS